MKQATTARGYAADAQREVDVKTAVHPGPAPSILANEAAQIGLVFWLCGDILFICMGYPLSSTKAKIIAWTQAS